jgi:PPK2 family polyphosphate:nucleotide phosphotransferase
MVDTKKYLIKPDSKVNLDDIETEDDGGLSRDRGEQAQDELAGRLDELQELLFAEGKHAVLVVLQAMDAGGKDSTIRSVFGGLNPQGCRVWNFKAPSKLELSHDYLWRVHNRAPGRGYIGVFNRSHYEDVIIVRVKNLVEEKRWKRRYAHINDFEKLLTDEGTVIRKFYLHISKDYQRKRFQRRLDRPDKHWKFNPADLKERARWSDYRRAYEAVLERCSTKDAPWYVIPAEKRWYRNLLISKIMVETLESLKMEYPKPDFDASTISID